MLNSTAASQPSKTNSATTTRSTNQQSDRNHDFGCLTSASALLLLCFLVSQRSNPFRHQMDEHIDKLDNNRPFPALDIKSPAEVLLEGLQLVYTEKRIYRVKGDALKSKTNEQRFKDHYGAKAIVVAHIWADLQTTTAPKARIKWLEFDMFLMALNFNYRCHTESEREAQFDRCPNTLRKWTWHHLIKVQLLQAEKIVFPDVAEFGDSEIIMTVDGTHSLFYEIQHWEFSINTDYFSHKKNHAGLCYELGIHLYKPKLMWMAGSYPAGPNDKSNFIRESGLRYQPSKSSCQKFLLDGKRSTWISFSVRGVWLASVSTMPVKF